MTSEDSQSFKEKMEIQSRGEGRVWGVRERWNWKMSPIRGAVRRVPGRAASETCHTTGSSSVSGSRVCTAPQCVRDSSTRGKCLAIKVCSRLFGTEAWCREVGPRGSSFLHGDRGNIRRPPSRDSRS